MQLDWYPSDARNRDLTSGYVFTSRAVGNAHSSVEIFERVYGSFLSQINPNCHVVVATYGHGKSHLALAMANFFGREAAAPEVQELLKGIAHAAPGKARNFKQFKAAHQSYLIVRLRGDLSADLTQQVARGVQVALDEHDASRGAQLGVWFEKALAALDRLKGESKKSAEAFLHQNSSDVASLRADLIERKSGVHALCLQAFEAALGVRPDFGASLEPGQLIQNATEEWCGEGKPFSGILILFDEFSAFIKKYAQSHVLSADSSLQNLLEGVNNCKDKAALVAFAQYEPETTARLVHSQLSAGQDEFDSLIKELNRLEKDQHYKLESAMEGVIDAYLQQDEDAWNKLMDNERVAEAVHGACDRVLVLLPERYNEAQGWDDEEVMRVLGMGCFPLHPLTTAILCSTTLREVADPRGVLGFVLTRLDRIVNENAVAGQRPNWIYAIELVDWFKEMLTPDDDAWRLYSNAVLNSRADVSDSPPEFHAVLRAMLLHQSARLPVRRGEGEFEKNLASLCGLSPKTCKQTLETLTDGGFIRAPADGSGIYTFWSLGEDGSKVDRALKAELQALQLDREKTRAYLNDAIKKYGRNDIEVSHRAGNAMDWAAEAWLLPHALLTAEKIREIVRGFRIEGVHGVVEAPRGFVLRPFASSEEEAQHLRAHASALLDEALQDWGETPPPVVMLLPSRPHPNLVNLLLRERVLHSWKSDANRVRELGKQAFDDTLKRAEDEIAKALDELGGHEFIVPKPFRAALDAKRIEGHNRSLEKVLDEVYGLAYRAAAPSFFTQYQRDKSNLRNAVCLASRHLARNSFAGYDEAAPTGPASDLRKKFLNIGSAGHWGVLEATRLREPQNNSTREAWKVLDEAIPPGADEVPIRGALLKLLNAPYGYDCNTLSLLFSAWYGFNAHALQLHSKEGRPISIEDCLSQNNKPQEFIDNLVWNKDVRIKRRDDEGWNEKIDEILMRERARDAFSIPDAEGCIAELREYSAAEGNDPVKARHAIAAAERLEADLNLAQEYARFGEKARGDIENARLVDAILKSLRALSEPPQTGCVRPLQDVPLEELRAQAQEKLKNFVEDYCAKAEKLPSLRDYSERKNNLARLRQMLNAANQSGYEARIAKAEDNLQARERELTDKDKDADFVARLKALKRETRLGEIRDGLRAIEEYSPHVAATQELMEETRAALQDAQAEAVQAVETWQARVAEIVSISDARRFTNDIQKRIERYEGAPEQETLQNVLTRIEALEKYFEKLADTRRERPANAKDVEKLARRLDVLAEGEELSQVQQELAAHTKALLEERVREDVQDAREWLEQAEQQNENGDDAPKLLQDLERGRAFLPEADSARLKALRRAVQKRIDADEVLRVEASFRKIKDKSKRAECLRILQKIAGEE